jgi:hypothetical protein
MTNLRKDWLIMASKDAAFCHAALSQYFGCFNPIQQKRDISDALANIAEAVRIVNSRIGMPDLETCNGTIGAVACIVNYEVSYINSILIGEV